MFQAVVALHLVTAALCSAIAVLAIRSVRREPTRQRLAGWAFVAFVLTSALTSVQRVGMPWLPRWDGWFLVGVSMDAIAALMLAVVFIYDARERRIVPQLLERARRSAAEYRRARHDYEQLLGHRIRNPLAVVQGVAHTLDARPDLPDQVRRELVASLVAAAEELSQVSLDPVSSSPEEIELRAVPMRYVDEPRGVRPTISIATAS